MKRLILIIVSLCLTMTIQAQVSKTVNATAGGLSTALTPTELSTVTNLTLTGTIDSRDFKTMRDNMPVLAVLDLGEVTIAAFQGDDGTRGLSPRGILYYPANQIPECAFNHEFIRTWGGDRMSYIVGPGKASLTSIILPTSINALPSFIFSGCTGLTSVTFPPLVTNIPPQAFNGCTALTSVTIPSASTYIGYAAFNNCTALTSVRIPSPVKTIEEFAFRNCTGLTTINIPPYVTSLRPFGFYGCRNLSSIYSYLVNPLDLVVPVLGDLFFDVNKTTCTLHVPYGTSALYAANNLWKDFTNIVEMPGSWLSISATAINLASAVSTGSVSITSTATWSAVSNQSWLNLSPASFSGNSALTITAETNSSDSPRTAIVTISSPQLDSQTIIVSQSGFIKTVEVTAGGLFAALTANERSTTAKLKITGTIDARDFKTMRDEMPALAELDISGATVAAYSGTEGTYPNNSDYLANVVPEGAFWNQSTETGKTSLISIILPSAVTSIGYWAFGGCTGLNSVKIPPSVTSIGSSAFMNCSGLTSFIIPGVTTISSNVFNGCKGLTFIYMPSSVTSIGNGAFSGCHGLTSIIIPERVNSIGSQAFYDCRNLISIYAYGFSPVDLSSSDQVFGGVNKVACILRVRYNKSLYAAANQWKDFVNIVEPGFLRLSATAINLASTSSTGSVTITSDVTWSAVSNQSWLTVNPTSFTGSSTLNLTAVANPSEESRTAVVTISSPGLVSQIVTISQVGFIKTVEVTAGGLFSALTDNERGTLTKLVITGTIDARDFKTMRDEMPLLAELDISATTITAYYGPEGTYSRIYPYPANVVPDLAFCKQIIYSYIGKTSLTSIILPSSSTSIGINAFRHCTGLTSVIVATSVTSIQAAAFLGCSGLTSIDIPSSTTIIGHSAFSECNGLTSITIPESVTKIDDWAFFYCINLTSIYALGVTPVDLSASKNVFTDINKTTCILHVPYGTSALYAAANQWRDFTKIVEIPLSGSIAANQTICSGITPATLTSTVAGAGQGTISYRWEYSYDGRSWLPTGTSGETYTPGTLTQTTLYRRITISTSNGTSWESAPTEAVTVAMSNTITLSSAFGTDAQTLCANIPITTITYSTTGATGATFSGLPNGVNGAWISNTVNISGFPSVSGTFNYTVTLTGGCGSVTKTGSIVVIAFPITPTVSISANRNNVTAGTPVTFTATTPLEGGAPTYIWFVNNSSAAIGASGTFVPAHGDVVNVAMTTNHACSTERVVTSNSITMVVKPVVASVSISPSQNNVCPGAPVTFTATPVNGGAAPIYQWFKNNYAVATGQSGTYVPKNGDVVYVMMQSSNPYATGSPAKSNVVIMVVDPNSVGVPAQPAYFTEGKAYVYQGQPDVRYTVPYVADVTYIWSYSGTGATITGTSNSVRISFSGTATSGILSVRASGSCGISEARSGSITVSNLKAGILARRGESITAGLPSPKNELKAYPNPSSGPVTFDFRINEKAKVILDIFSTSGMRISRIFEGDVEADVIQTVIFNESLAPGVYIYMLKWKDQVITGKLIIN